MDAAPKIKNTPIVEHLECAICFELLKDSRLLTTCLHTFCFTCLERLVQQQSGQTHLPCPSCRQKTPLPKTGPADLPKNRLVNQLVEALQSTTDTLHSCEECDEACEATGYCQQCQLRLCEACVRAHARSKSRCHHTVLAIGVYQELKDTNALPVREKECPSHHSEQVEVFCITCQKVICYKCAAVDHQPCDKANLESVCSEKKAEIDALINQIRENIVEPLQSAIKSNKQHETTIAVSAETAKTSVIERFDACQQLLQQRKEQLLKDIDRHRSTWQEFVLRSRTQLTADLHTATQVVEASKQVMGKSLRSDVVSSAPDIVKQLTSLCQMIKVHTENSSRVKQPISLKMCTDLRQFQSAVSNIAAVDTNLVAFHRQPPVTVQNITSTFVISQALFPITSPPTVHAQPPEGGSAAEVVVSKHHETCDSYLVKLKTRAPGKHKVHIQVSSGQMESVSKTFDVQSLPVPDKPKKTVGQGLLSYPNGVTMCDGHVLVADCSNRRLREFDIDGNLVRSFQACGKLASATVLPSGVVMATDKTNDCIQVFRRDGQVMHTFGGPGSKTVQFSKPRGIGVTSDGHIVVSEAGSNQLQILDVAAGKSIRQFSTCNNRFKLHHPRILAIEQMNDHIIVTNYRGDSVEEFNKDGKHIRSFGKGRGRQLGELSGPNGVALHPSGNVLVSEWRNDRVSIFTREGEFAGLWAQVKSPEDVTCSKDGQVFVSQSHIDDVLLYYV